MSDKATKGSWVEIHLVVLTAGERAPQVPEDTRRVPLEMRIRGHLVHDGTVGDEVEIVSLTGRRIRGKLMSVNPAYAHEFGPPIPELSRIGAELREVLRSKPS